ncbi:MAG: FKBP-type peptidyl-prolyl cis-trans isomerase [Nitritalea sp.]
MRKYSILGLAMAILFSLNACLEQGLSDAERMAERDNDRLRAFLEQNNIQAESSQLGFFWVKEVANPTGRQIQNRNKVAIRYEIKTTEGQLIDDRWGSEAPLSVFQHGEDRLVPLVLNLAAGLAREGEEFTLYVPSYLAYRDYSYEQLIQPSSNLVIRVRWEFILDDDSLELIEADKIQAFKEENGLEERYRRIDPTQDLWIWTSVSEEALAEHGLNPGDLVTFEFEMLQLDETVPFSSAAGSQAPTIEVGAENQFAFIPQIFTAAVDGMEMEVIVPSILAYGNEGVQVFPREIRRDLIRQGAIPPTARPFEPILFKARIMSVLRRNTAE